MHSLSQILWLREDPDDPILLGCVPHAHAEPNAKQEKNTHSVTLVAPHFCDIQLMQATEEPSKITI
jgi:hypothetical protein